MGAAPGRTDVRDVKDDRLFGVAGDGICNGGAHGGPFSPLSAVRSAVKAAGRAGGNKVSDIEIATLGDIDALAHGAPSACIHPCPAQPFFPIVGNRDCVCFGLGHQRKAGNNTKRDSARHRRRGNCLHRPPFTLRRAFHSPGSEALFSGQDNGGILRQHDMSGVTDAIYRPKWHLGSETVKLLCNRFGYRRMRGVRSDREGLRSTCFNGGAVCSPQ